MDELNNKLPLGPNISRPNSLSAIVLVHCVCNASIFYSSQYIVCELVSTMNKIQILLNERGRRGRDRMVVGCIGTYAISAYHH
jgi:hypothetical protein